MIRNKLNTIELFAGCGGLVDGFEKTGKYKTLSCVEWNDKPHEVLKKRLKNKYGYVDTDKTVLRFDIQRTDELINGWKDDLEYGTNVGLKKIIGPKEVDLIVGGPPCQAYSMAGRVQDENGMHDDYRNYLFESYIKVVKVFKPKVVVFENVEGILSAKPGGINIIKKITEEFFKSGYIITNNIRKDALLDMSEFGVSQRRKRVILIGLNKEVFGDNCYEILDEFYNKRLHKFKSSKVNTVKDAIGDLPKLMPREQEEKIGTRKYSHSPDMTEYKDHYPRYHNKRDIDIFRELALDIESGRNNYKSIEALKKLYTEKTGKESNIHKYNVLRWDEPSNTIPAHLKKDGLRHIHPDSQQARSITVREAARLQSFDDDFEFSGSMSSDYEMIGNAVPPEFSRRLAEALYEVFKEHGLI
ncbi:DNA cytosine methyltransferase [Clostridium culturomicium]|uniref:DNA cytosine methyltransferase n=1 Tax=Clostridium culturomicium TaxID=1499683 RepID=UPI00058C54E5|nr:DNA cytosine methyltransferase [Clostridium culturomicium]